MKRILLFLALSLAAYVSFSQSPIYGRLRVISGIYDNYFQNSTDTFKLGWRTDAFQFRYSGNKRFMDFVKADSSVKIYNKLILESPNDTMLSIRGGGMNVTDGSVLFSGTTGATPASGAGTRMMWIPSKAAFRAGEVDDVQWNTDSIGMYSVSFGYNSYATGGNAFSVGEGSLASGFYSVSMGGGNKASGDGTFCAGELSVASGTSSVTIGNESSSTGFYALATGRLTNSSGVASASFNASTKANSFVLSVFGRFNDTTSISKIAWVSTDPLFKIGNGTDDATRNDAFRVLKNGKTFIGDSSSITDAILVVDPTDSTSNFIGDVSVGKSLQVGNNTADTSLIVNGNLKADTVFAYCPLPYKVYTALLTQTGTDAPVATILQNNIGNIIWTRDGTGEYLATLNGAFPENKTFVLLTPNEGGIAIGGSRYSDSNQLYISLIDAETGTYYDALGNGAASYTSIEIRIYP
jgi:hypothetical protein